ncbi:hypothetical protein LRAMOSA07077 [Lichtheimia ramosa]|uniref:LysM domain-containing protein n=1 Tax=Lichtheimia ramosa TaxID=688394 RepID=A0A077W9W9_9FUNG|nr:hypothetical protein LRAMOSA07077 [Lichtheimia ramosa]
MLLQRAITLAAIGILAFTGNHNTAHAEPLAIVHGTSGSDAIKISASYLAAFDNDNEPEPSFELVDTPDDISSKLISLKKRGSGCADYYTVKSGDTCDKIAKKHGISTKEFMSLNSQINSKCTNLHVHKKYCVEEGSSSSSSSSSSSGSSSSGGCSKKHKVTNSDTCISVAKKYGLSLNEFYNLNSQVHRGSCDNLDTGKYYCVASGGSNDKSSSKETSKKDDKKDDDDDVSKKVTNMASKTKKSSKSKSKSSSKSEKRKKLQSKAAFTYYWIAQQSDYKGGSKVAIKTCGGKTIAKVNENYADALVMEGTGVVGNKIVNLGGCSCNAYKCFEEINRSEEPYGITAYGSPLRPYVTIAANDLPKGKKIYVPQIDGWSVPGSGKKHNGCLLVDDQSWSFSSHHIDFYVYEQDYYQKLDKQHKTTKVDIYDGGNCKLLNYL